MKLSVFFIFACLLLTTISTTAQTMQSSGGSMMQKPQCKTGDPVVAVNTQKKMYMTADQVKAKMSGMSQEQKQMAMQKKHVKWMCKSDADAMGAKPAPGQ